MSLLLQEAVLDEYLLLRAASVIMEFSVKILQLAAWLFALIGKNV